MNIQVIAASLFYITNLGDLKSKATVFVFLETFSVPKEPVMKAKTVKVKANRRISNGGAAP